ncbi:MAG: tyrosine--tRNA ligase [Pseudonocardiaceae bacterium]
MAYHVPPVPPDVADDPQAQATYLLEDGFSAAPADALVDKLRRREPLRVKFGVDPTAPSVTWGWSVPLRRLRRFQELGHTAVLVIGDFTAQVGDPSGRSATRVRLSAAQVNTYVQSCMASLLEILSPERLELRRNSEWLNSLGMAGALELTAQATVAQLLERNDFSKRFDANEPISLIEFIYPLLQGHDSVAVNADVELGGTDQYFNCMLARTLQQRAGQRTQAVVSAPLLVGLDGKKKMSQSVGNYIGVAEPPGEVFGKVMSLPDDAMPAYVHLALDLRPADKDTMIAESGGVQLKRRLAREMIAMFHGAVAAADAEAEFDRVFVRRDVPSEMGQHTTPENYVPRILVDLGFASSLSDARRGIKGGGVRVDGAALANEHATLGEGTWVLQLGRRRFARVTVRRGESAGAGG